MMRRSLLQLLAGGPLAGLRRDGLVRPLNAPPAQQTPVGVQPGVTNAVIIANRVIIFGPGGGWFIYTGTPGLGNPPILYASSGTTDPYGNPIISDALVNSSGAVRAFLQNAALVYEQGIYTADLGYSVIGSTAVIDLSITDGNNAHIAGFSLLPQAAPQMVLRPDTVIVANHPGAAYGTPETPQSMAGGLSAGFAVGGTTPTYEFMPDNTIMLSGAVNLTANQAAGTTFFSLAAVGYPTPSQGQNFVTQNNLAGSVVGSASVSISTSGHLMLTVAGNNGQFVSLDGVRIRIV